MAVFDKVINFMEKYVAPVGAKIGNQRHLLAVRDGVVSTMPLTIIGSFFLIIRFLPFNGYEEWMASKGLDKYLAYASDGTFNILALVVVICIAYRLSIIYKMNDLALPNGIIALVSFFVTLMPTIGEDGKPSFDYFGTRSIFVAIIVALISVEIIKKIVDRKWVIKLPESVPVAISRSFTSLVPGVIVVIFWTVIAGIFINTPFKNIHDIIVELLAKPIQAAGNTLPGILALETVSNLLWTLGIHGSLVTSTVGDAILLSNTGINAGLASQGLAPFFSNGFMIKTEAFGNITGSMGGSGATFGFVLLMIFRAKSKQMKDIGKLSMAPAMFNINEPVIFGCPIVLNPLLMIPHILAGPIIISINWAIMKANLVAIPYASVPWTMPFFLSGFIASGFSFSTLIMSLLNLGLAILIWYPFFVIYDKQLAKQESGK